MSSVTHTCCCDELVSCCVHQVELLWRRAEGDAREVRSGKVYMLVRAELLDYDISRRVEESLEKHSHAVPGEGLLLTHPLVLSTCLFM